MEEADGSPPASEQAQAEAAPAEEETSAQVEAAERSESAAEGQAAEEEQAAGRSVYVELLDLIPDNSNARASVILIDYVRVRESQGIESIPDLPNSAEVRDSLVDLLGFLTGVSLWGYGPTFLSGGNAAGIGESAILPYNVGYSIADVDQDIRAGLPPEQYTAARGRFDPQRTEQAIQRCGDCPASATGEYRGVSYARGEDFADIDFDLRNAAPAFDSLGRGGRLAVLDRYVLRTLWTQGLEDMVDASRGGRSLATNPDFRAAAAALEELGNYTVWLSTRTQSVDHLRDAYLDPHLGTGLDVAEFASPPGPGVVVLQPYAVLGLGVGADGDGPFLTVVLVHDTEAQAMDNVGLLLPRRVAEEDSLFFSRRFLVSNDPRAPVRHGPAWSELIERIDARAEGRLLIAKLRVTLRVPSADRFFVQLGPLRLHS